MMEEYKERSQSDDYVTVLVVEIRHNKEEAFVGRETFERPQEVFREFSGGMSIRIQPVNDIWFDGPVIEEMWHDRFESVDDYLDELVDDIQYAVVKY